MDGWSISDAKKPFLGFVWHIEFLSLSLSVCDLALSSATSTAEERRVVCVPSPEIHGGDAAPIAILARYAICEHCCC